MVALLAAVIFQSLGRIDPSVVDLLLSNPGWVDAYPTIGRALVELGEDELAFRVFDRWEPPRNRELYDWHRRDRNAVGMLAAISHPSSGAPLPILELMYHQDDAHIRKAVRFVRLAEAEGENLNLLGDEWRKQLKLSQSDTQLVDPVRPVVCLGIQGARGHSLRSLPRRRICRQHGNREIPRVHRGGPCRACDLLSGWARIHLDRRASHDCIAPSGWTLRRRGTVRSAQW